MKCQVRFSGQIKEILACHLLHLPIEWKSLITHLALTNCSFTHPDCNFAFSASDVKFMRLLKHK